MEIVINSVRTACVLIGNYSNVLHFRRLGYGSWYSFHKNMTNLNWIDDDEIVIRHTEMPGVPKDVLRRYVRELIYAKWHWRLCRRHSLKVFFSFRKQPSFQALLRKEMEYALSKQTKRGGFFFVRKRPCLFMKRDTRIITVKSTLSVSALFQDASIYSMLRRTIEDFFLHAETYLEYLERIQETNILLYHPKIFRMGEAAVYRYLEGLYYAMKGWADYPEHNIMAYFKEADRERLCPIIESIQEADRNRKGRKSGFYFVDDPDMVRVTDGCVVEVEGIEGGTQLFAAYVSQLQLFSISASLRRDDPDLDWDDFYDVLTDTNLMEERDIVIHHRGIPHFPEEDSLSLYLQLLQEIVEEWNTKMMHSVMIYFSHEDEQTVLGILSQLREEENKSIKEYLQRKASGLIK